MVDLINIRKKIVQIIYDSQAGHLNSSFSCLELIYASLKFFSKKKKYENFVLSKGHAAVAYYAVLNFFKIIKDKDIENYCKDGSKLYGHPFRDKKSKISFTTGSLGNGLAAAAGFAYGKKINKDNQNKVICLVGDGECNEGIFWETLMLVNKFNLNNLIIIIDDNLTSNEGSKLPNLEKVISAFDKIEYQSVDGHNSEEIIKLIDKNYPYCQVFHAKTQYGYGSNITLNNKKYHHPKLSQSEFKNINQSLSARS